MVQKIQKMTGIISTWKRYKNNVHKNCDLWCHYSTSNGNYTTKVHDQSPFDLLTPRPPKMPDNFWVTGCKRPLFLSPGTSDNPTTVMFTHLHTVELKYCHIAISQVLVWEYLRAVQIKNWTLHKCFFKTILWQTFLPAGLHEAQPCQYCFYSVVQK